MAIPVCGSIMGDSSTGTGAEVLPDVGVKVLAVGLKLKDLAFAFSLSFVSDSFSLDFSRSFPTSSCFISI